MKNPLGIEAFGLHLKKLRESKLHSQQELADIANISKQTIYRIEKGKFSVTLDVLLSLAKALNLSLAELVNFSTPEERLS